ncbi:MAG TPA: kelch repeat-containing protein [Bacteroidales bacterium]|nr:kelch repeat-containing protein [Bacteroidales bacterium]
MKKTIAIFCSLFLTLNLFSQGYWTQKADFGGTPKYWAVGFAINGKGYAGLGRGSGFNNSSDLWEYNPVTNTWTQKSSFPGGARYSSHVFVINNKAYFCSGAYWSGISGDYTPYNDVWEYNPATDTWTQKNNFPGPGRHDAFAFSFAGTGYLCFGQDDNQISLNDLWAYNPNTDTWTQKASFPGTARSGGIQFGFGKYGYIGLGRDSNAVSLGDVWRYDCSQNTWAQMANFPSASRTSSSTFVTDNRAYIVCGYNFQSSSYPHELWEYNPNDDTWIQREDFPPGDRACGTAFSINNKGYFGLGNVFSTFKKDFWEYTPSCLVSLNTNVTVIGATIYALASGASYQWLDCDNGYAVLPNDTNQSYTPTVSGNYAVIVTQNSCSDTSDCMAVDICDALNTNVTVIGATIYALASGASYQWLDCDNGFAVIPNDTNQSYTPAGSGNYAVIVTQNSCSDTSVCTAVDICDAINTNVTVIGPTIYALAAGATYQWLNCDVGLAVIDNETNQSYSPPVSGSYAVIVTQDNCSDTSECTTVNTIGIEEVENSGITCYPNPLQNEITIDLKSHELKSDILLTDINGKIVRIFPATALKEQKLIIGQLPAGTYILSFDLDSKRVSKEIIIK